MELDSDKPVWGTTVSVTEIPRRSLPSLGAIRAGIPGYIGLVYALVTVWGAGDVLSTYFAVAATNGAGMEANPWMRLLFEIEPLLVLAVKAAVVLYVGVVLLACRSIVEEVPGWRFWMLGTVVIGWLVVVNNLAVGLAAMA